MQVMLRGPGISRTKQLSDWNDQVLQCHRWSGVFPVSKTVTENKIVIALYITTGAGNEIYLLRGFICF